MLRQSIFEGLLMRIAVVTPYCRETLEQLQRCHESVAQQTIPTDHILVADGHPMAEVDTWKCIHIKAPHHNDYGDTPRIIGTASASTLGYDAILLLDGDNWFDPDHVETLLAVQKQTGADVVTCPRTLRRSPDLSVMGVDFESDGVVFNDTNCYLLMRSAFPLFRAWSFKDQSLGIVGDRIFWNACKANANESNIKIARSPKATINYVTTFSCHYTQYGEQAPDHAKEIVRTTDGQFQMMNSKLVREMAAQQEQTMLPPDE